jgi:DNA-directed RNA polymerase specialized sigma24 family protein
MTVRYYWGRPKDVIRWYLRGTLYLSAQSRQRYIEKTGADPGNLPRLLKLLEELDELFETVDTDSIALLCLRYVELLSIPDTAERTGLSNSQISTRTAKVMKNAKEIIIKA